MNGMDLLFLDWCLEEQMHASNLHLAQLSVDIPGEYS